MCPLSARARKAASISSTLVARSASIVRSTSEPVGVGTRTAMPLQATLQLGDDEPDRPRRPGARRHEVDGRRPGAPQVLVRAVEQALIGGVGVHGRHLAVADAHGLVEDLRPPAPGSWSCTRRW